MRTVQLFGIHFNPNYFQVNQNLNYKFVAQKLDREKLELITIIMKIVNCVHANGEAHIAMLSNGTFFSRISARNHKTFAYNFCTQMLLMFSIKFLTIFVKKLIKLIGFS